MRLHFIAALCIGALLLSVSALSQQQDSSLQGGAQKLPADLRIPAILRTTLSSKKTKVGDQVNLVVAADVKDTKGVVIIPRHAKLTGHVTQASRYEKNKQAAMLSFVVDRAEWNEHTAELDAPVYGIDVLASNGRQGEQVGEMHAATLGVTDPVDVVSTETMSDTRSGSVGAGYAHAVRDAAFHTVLMQLHRVPDAAIRSSFMKRDGDLQIPSEFLIFLMNGMQPGS